MATHDLVERQLKAEAGTPRSRRAKPSITLNDVAKLAGVSPITVSRALNAPDVVSPATLRKVLDAVRLTGYVPDLLAGALASSRSRLIAAIIPHVEGSVFLHTVQTLTEALAESNYQLMLGQTGYAEANEDALIEAIIGRRPDAIVLTGIMHSSEARRRLHAAAIPVVETWDLTSTPIDMLVGFSHEKVGIAVAEYLNARGRHHVAIIRGNDYRAEVRSKAFTECAIRLGLARKVEDIPVHVVPSPTTFGQGRIALGELFARNGEVDAIFCSSDLLALGVMTEAHVRNIAIPERLAVVGFGDLSFAKDAYPSLTTVSIDGSAMGRQAARFIAERLAGREIAQRVIDIGFSIAERASA